MAHSSEDCDKIQPLMTCFQCYLHRLICFLYFWPLDDHILSDLFVGSWIYLHILYA